METLDSAIKMWPFLHVLAEGEGCKSGDKEYAKNIRLKGEGMLTARRVSE